MLVVDDEVMVRQLVSEMLRELGFEVCEAASAGAAMRLLKRGLPISTVITDIRMAETTGIELAGEICRMRPETRVIYRTGYAKEFAGSHSQLLTHDVLVKPFTFEQLENVMIQRKRSRH